MDELSSRLNTNMTLSKVNGVRGLYLDVHEETTETQTRADIFDQEIKNQNTRCPVDLYCPKAVSPDGLRQIMLISPSLVWPEAELT